MKEFFANIKKEIQEEYNEFLSNLFFIIGKKLFSVVSSVSPNDGEVFVVFSNDPKLVELVKSVATPAPVIEQPKKKRGRPRKKT